MPNTAPDTIVLKKLPVGHIIRSCDFYMESGVLRMSSLLGITIQDCWCSYYCQEKDFPPQKKTWTLWKRKLLNCDQIVYAWTHCNTYPDPTSATSWSKVTSVEAVNKPSLDDLKVRV